MSGRVYSNLPAFVSKDEPPTGVSINGTTMTVSWDVPISPAIAVRSDILCWPASGDFTATFGSTARHPQTVTSDDNGRLVLTFAPGAAYNEAVTLSYNLNHDAISVDSTLTPSSAEAVASFTGLSVTVKGLLEGSTKITATASADKTVQKDLSVTVLPVETDLIESLTVSPLPPYHSGEEVEVLAKLKRSASSVTATVKRPDGNIDTPAVEVDGTGAWLAYTLPELGSYTVTVKATDATTGTVWERTATLTVTEDSVKPDGGSSGGYYRRSVSRLPEEWRGVTHVHTP